MIKQKQKKVNQTKKTSEESVTLIHYYYFLSLMTWSKVASNTMTNRELRLDHPSGLDHATFLQPVQKEVQDVDLCYSKKRS